MNQNTKVKFTDEQLAKLRKYAAENGCESLTAALVDAVDNSPTWLSPSTSPTKNRTAICMRLDPEWMDWLRGWHLMPFQQVVASVLDHL